MYSELNYLWNLAQSIYQLNISEAVVNTTKEKLGRIPKSWKMLVESTEF